MNDLRPQPAPAVPGPPRYRPDIDGLRGIAVLAVVGFHAFPTAVPGGFVGVDVFFIISGYLITGIVLQALQNRSFSLADFYLRRIRRIFPALIVVLLSVLVAGWFLFLSGDYRQLGKQVAAGAFFVSNFVLWQEAGYFDASADTKPLLHLWSLSIEEQFYLAWPLFLVVLSKVRRGWVIFTSVTMAASLLANLVLSARHPVSAFYLPQARLWELQLGGLLAMMAVPGAWRALGPRPGRLLAPTTERAARIGARLRPLCAWIGLLLIALAITCFDRSVTYPGWRALVPAFGTLLVLSAEGSPWIVRRVLAHRLLVGVGLISYPLYLWHWPLLAGARVVGGPLAPTTGAALIGLSVLLAWLTYHFVEKPIRSRQPSIRARALPAALVAGITAAGLSGIAVFALQGVPSRFPAVVQHLTDYRYDFLAAYRGELCFIEKIEQIDRARNFSPRCVEEASDASHAAPLIALWGDSMAAHLYPGLKEMQTRYRFRIAQFNVASCPPILGYSSKALGPEGSAICAQLNESTAQRIKSAAPDSVVLAANAWSPDDLAQLTTTIASLRAWGVGKIIIMGPVPRWTETLPTLLYKRFSADPMHRVPARLTQGLHDDLWASDRRWNDIAQALSVDYLSALNVLCDAQGCLTRVGDAPDQLTAWDFVHLTAAGSAFLIDGIFPRLFSTPPAPAATPAKPASSGR